jgi:protein O-GlcNAcase/histone acetyltransferase
LTAGELRDDPWIAMQDESKLMVGVIEGFYGRPWSQTERFELFDWMAAWGLNTYLYAPKDDLKHRALWRETYSAGEAESLAELLRSCAQRAIRFIHALGPGLDIGYSSEADLELLKRRFEQMLGLGCRSFALLFDDIPDAMNPRDAERFGSFASAQCHVANALFLWGRERAPDSSFLFCPTPYCGRMAAGKLGGADYLAIIGRELWPEIDVFWTGPEIISQTIPVDHIRELQSVLRRKPVIWDNLHANDYDGQRFYCGPYAGRPPELRNLVQGFLTNPNCEFPLNFVPLRVFAQYLASNENWDSRAAYLSAMAEWLPRLATIGPAITLEDLVFLGDCYYLPHEDGPEARSFLEQGRALLDRTSHDATGFLARARRLREFCVRLTVLRDRPLFHALSRRVWDLREELDLLERYVAFQSEGSEAPFTSDFHLPGTHRGGFVRRLQQLLNPQPDGSFKP